MELLEKITQCYGPSGREDKIRELLRGEIEKCADEVRVDNLGNLICRRNGGGKKLMMAAHMDEIGVIVTHIDDNGFLRFAAVGGVYAFNCINRGVRFEKGVSGVISFESKGAAKDATIEKLYIDIGAKSAAEASEKVQIGDIAVFEGEFEVMGRRAASKTMDDRAGCYALLEAFKSAEKCPNDLYAVFTVQEELGLRGAKVAAQSIAPDMAIAVDVSGVGDTPESKVTELALGKGPSVKMRDASYVINPKVKEFMIKCAEDAKIPYQREAASYGGTDAGAIMLTGCGVPAATTSIPTRYIHSPKEVIDLDDLENTVKFLRQMIETEL